MQRFPRFLMLIFATLLLVFAVVFICVLLLASSVRWLLTGRKPTLVLFAQAYQQWKHMAKGTDKVKKSDGDIIDVEVKKISKDDSFL